MHTNGANNNNVIEWIIYSSYETPTVCRYVLCLSDTMTLYLIQARHVAVIDNSMIVLVQSRWNHLNRARTANLAIYM